MSLSKGFGHLISVVPWFYAVLQRPAVIVVDSLQELGIA
jgi:hypothetical protein